MTRARIRKESGYNVVKIDGHAGFNPGNDIVCAAVSTLMFAYLNTLIEEGIDYELFSADGSYMIKSKSDDVEPYLMMLTVGLKMIRQEYPEYVEVE